MVMGFSKERLRLLKRSSFKDQYINKQLKYRLQQPSEASHENISHQRANPRTDSSSPQEVQIPHQRRNCTADEAGS